MPATSPIGSCAPRDRADAHDPASPAGLARLLRSAVRGASKPRLVGRYPCVVFATVAPDGRRHAHRVYVAHDGQGKAELGADARGGRRDPKKSARLKEGESAAGCAVLWGDPATAPHLLMAEGIETAAALALAHREEVEAGGVAVAAALSTSGLRTFAPWPATRTITIAADRDEAGEADDRGYRAGERAARAFALTYHERLEIRIALPGQEGEEVDWLDVLRRDGVQAVRAGLDGAAAVHPDAAGDRRRQAARRERLRARRDRAHLPAAGDGKHDAGLPVRALRPDHGPQIRRQGQGRRGRLAAGGDPVRRPGSAALHPRGRGVRAPGGCASDGWPSTGTRPRARSAGTHGCFRAPGEVVRVRTEGRGRRRACRGQGP